jgi:hypothetical protein
MMIILGCMIMLDLKIDNEGPLVKLQFVIPANAGIQGIRSQVEYRNSHIFTI